MKRKFKITLTFDAYGETPEEARQNGEWAREELAERLGITGENGDFTSVKVEAVATEPTPWTTEELEEIADEERAEAARRDRLTKTYGVGAYLKLAFSQGSRVDARVVSDDGVQIAWETPSGSGRTPREGAFAAPIAIVDIEPFNPFCGHGVNTWLRDCQDCASMAKHYLHGLVRGPVTK